MISIKHRYTETTLCEFDVETIKQAVEKGKADLREADLREANLRRVNLYGADLREANLRRVNLRRVNLYGADLYGANLNGADLREANLRKVNLNGADLREANLRRVNLREAIIDGEIVSKNPIHITCGLKYAALITDGYMRLGCTRYKHSEWAEFSDEQISEMDDGALEFWKQWKEPLLAMCKAHAG